MGESEPAVYAASLPAGCANGSSREAMGMLRAAAPAVWGHGRSGSSPAVTRPSGVSPLVRRLALHPGMFSLHLAAHGLRGRERAQRQLEDPMRTFLLLA